VTFSVRGKKWEIPRTTITRWTGEERKNWFAFNLAEHADAKGKKTNEPIFINRNSMAFDYIITLLSGEDVDFSLLTPLEQQRLMDDIKFYRMEKIADKHLKNRLITSRVEQLQSKNNRNLKLNDSSGKVLYLTVGDTNSFPERYLPKAQTTVKNILTKGDLGGFDVVIVAAYHGIVMSNDDFGEMLADFVDKGGNVVICGFCNTTSWVHPTGRFYEHYHPFRLRPVVKCATADWMGSFDKDHPLKKGVEKLRQTGDLSKVHGELNSGDVEVVARWSDGSNMIAIRHDKKGLITSIGFQTGSAYSEGDIMKIVLNAIQLRKSE
jgi:hypothetical protein